MADGNPEKRKKRHSSKRPVESIVTGAAITAVFGFLYMTHPTQWFWIFPAVFGGVLPMFEGVRRLATSRRDRESLSQERETEAERVILKAAQEMNGRVTPAAVALRSSLTIKEAQGALEQLAREGHASMNVTSEGVIEFQFPSFLPPLGDGRAEVPVERKPTP